MYQIDSDILLKKTTLTRSYLIINTSIIVKGDLFDV